MVESTPALFGSRRRTEVLLLTALLNETYPREVARLLDAPLRSVQVIVQSLEEAGIIVSLYSGKERRISLNRRFGAYEELRALLMRMGQQDKDVLQAAESLRRRPRTAGKPL